MMDSWKIVDPFKDMGQSVIAKPRSNRGRVLFLLLLSGGALAYALHHRRKARTNAKEVSLLTKHMTEAKNAIHDHKQKMLDQEEELERVNQMLSESQQQIQELQGHLQQVIQIDNHSNTQNHERKENLQNA